jgi:hypothetical protein
MFSPNWLKRAILRTCQLLANNVLEPEAEN